MEKKENKKEAFIGFSAKKPFYYPFENLKKHVISLGSSGSGKTVFSKIIIEECAKKGIPAIIVDPQGDIASLALKGDKEEVLSKGITEEDYELFLKNVDVDIYTPISSKGIPISLNPLSIGNLDVSEEEVIPVIHSVAKSVTKLLGYDTENDKGKTAEAVIYTVIKDFHNKKKKIETFEELSYILNNVDESLKKELMSFLSSEKELELIIKKLKFMNVGEKKLLFELGIPLDIGNLFGKAKDKEKGSRTKVSIIYLNTLPNHSDKEFFISILTTQLYQWMLENPSPRLQGLYFIDEIAPFIPAGSEKPIPKPILKLLFKQARKYGIGCIIATQNPGDIDYKAFSQFGTWAIGRLSLKQDQKKIEKALKSLSSEDFSSMLPKLRPGNFLIFAPDINKNLIELSTRWLYSKHATLNEEDVKRLMDDKRKDIVKTVRIRNNYKKKSKAKKAKSGLIFLKSIEKDTALKIAEGNRKREFIIGRKEEISEFNTELVPYIEVVVRAREKAIFAIRKESFEYDVLFNAVDCSILRINNKRSERYVLFEKLFAMKENPVRIYAAVNGFKSRTNADKLIKKTGFSKQAVSKSLKELSKERLVEFTTENKDILNINTLYPKFSSIKEFSSKGYVLSNNDLEGKVIKPRIDVKSLGRFLGNIFEDTEIVETRIVYIPEFVVKFKSKNKVRVIRINGFSADIEE